MDVCVCVYGNIHVVLKYIVQSNYNVHRQSLHMYA